MNKEQKEYCAVYVCRDCRLDDEFSQSSGTNIILKRFMAANETETEAELQINSFKYELSHYYGTHLNNINIQEIK